VAVRGAQAAQRARRRARGEGGGAYEADGAKGFTSCSKTVVGGVANFQLAPGGGELLLLDVVG
jgi:hypothetical protein